MIAVDLNLLYGWMNAFIWPFVRILALIGAMPLFGESSIPVRLKVAYAALITIVITPAIGPLPDLPTGSWASLALILQQILIGISMGLVIRIVFGAVITAGEFIGLQMGLAFASFFDPATGANTAVLSRLLNVVAMLLFLAFNGHLIVLAILIRSFEALPITASPILNPDGWGVLFEWSAQVMLSGMLLALPLIMILLTISLSMGILNRTAQQLSVFAVGFPISLMTGLILLAVVVPQTAPFMEQFFEESYQALSRMIIQLAPG